VKLYYYQGETSTNFGDELNAWIWPQLLPDAFNGTPDVLFLGIGSILFDFFPADQKKIVFGAGYGGYTPKPVIDAQWKIYFVRGKLTAAALALDAELAAGDAAILVRSCRLPQVAKSHRASFMPHWESVERGDWPGICQRAGLHFIDPRLPVEHVLSEILASEMVVTEAMHGAIVADALRVPWIAIEPLRFKHRMKWFDWASVLDLKLEFRRVAGPNLLEWLLARTSSARWRWRLEKRLPWLSRFETPFAAISAAALKRYATQSPQLSSERAIHRAHQRMLEELARLKSDLIRRPDGQALANELASEA
jgi:succinoglycan biosynthesis protein ExoV